MDNPCLIRRLTYRRTNHNNRHASGSKEEGTATPFDMGVLDDLDRFYLVMDVSGGTRFERLDARVRFRHCPSVAPGPHSRAYCELIDAIPIARDR